MNDTSANRPAPDELPPVPRLLCAYAPAAARPWHALCWQLDRRLGDVVRRGGDPTIAAIRLAWWDAVLVEDDRAKGRGEPLVDAWRATAFAGAAPLAGQLIDGWRVLLGEEALSAADLESYAQGRGNGLFALLAGGADAPSLGEVGAVWALWDLSGHTRDAALANAAIARAGEFAAGLPALPRGRAYKPLRLLAGLAIADSRAGRVPQNGFAPRHYRSLLWRSLFS